MKFEIDTAKKTAALIDGTSIKTSFPLGPGPDAPNPHFDSMMADLQPVLDAWFTVEGNNNT